MTHPASIRRRATIADVAVTAGVSKATVSRYFNHRERLLSTDTTARVAAAVAACNFIPSPMASALSRGRSRLVGLVVADIANPYSVAVLHGAERVCQEAGYLLVLCNLGNPGLDERAAIDALASYQVDGFILNTLGAGGWDAADALHGKPAVLVDRAHPHLSSDLVALDNATAMQAACSHLVESGWSDLLYVTEARKAVSTRRERGEAFRAFVAPTAEKSALGAANPIRGELFEWRSEEANGAPGAQESLKDALRQLRSRCSGKRRAGVIAGNAVMTLRVANAVKALGWTFGSDIGFVGFDDPEWAGLIGPGLSTIAQPTDQIGAIAARCLLDRLGGLAEPPRRILLPGRLHPRGSSRR